MPLRVPIAFALLFLASTAPLAAKDLFDEGLRLCREGWERSLPVQQRLAAEHPDHAAGWLCLARALQGAGRHREVIAAGTKALELGAAQPWRLMPEIARAHLALGDREAALDWLEKAVNAGSPVRQRWARDPDFAPLKDDSRFRAAALDVDVTGFTREEGWRRDIAILASEMKRLHYRPFRARSEAQFDADIAAIARDVEKLDDHQLETRLMRLLVLHGDGHTQLLPTWRAGANQRFVPLPMEMLPEGLVITAVRPGDEALLWGRVVEIGGRPVADAIAAIRDLVPRDNEPGVTARVPYFLRFPQMLAPLGFAKDASRATYTVRTRGGEWRTAEFEAAAPFTGEWVRVPPGHDKPLPAWLARQREAHWFEVRPEEKLVYLQFNRVQDALGGEKIAALAKRLGAAIDRDDVEHVVVDLRANGGGNTDLLKPLLEAILGTRKTHRGNGLFVIAGRHTFSAAMNFAALLERNATPVFVGEPTGSRPNFIGEGSEIILPWSRARISISFLMWQNAQPQDSRTWIAPRLSAPPTQAALMAGRDPAMEAILARIKM
jgi:hypothetical protein